MKHFHVYIMANQKPVLYVGVTSDLCGRVVQHREGSIDGFTKTYGLKKLVYYEEAENAEVAFNREKQLKRWKRQWKLDLIKGFNPSFDDLTSQILGSEPKDDGYED